MGNCFGLLGNCFGRRSNSRKRLVTAARDGDVEQARKLLEMNPSLAKYTTFGGFSSPLHASAAAGHSEIVMMLLEHGADVNSKNFYGQTALMEACRSGFWEVVQALLLSKCDVFKADYLSGWTALHFAAQGGHVPCIKLLVADSAPAASSSNSPSDINGDKDAALSRFINKAANGGLTALHLAALSGNAECVQLLLDLQADVSLTALYHSSSAASIGAGSTPLHYAASSGNLKSCQVLLARGASRSAVNGHGWLPVDVARECGRDELVPLLSRASKMTIPDFPALNYPSLALTSILKIASSKRLGIIINLLTMLASHTKSGQSIERDVSQSISSQVVQIFREHGLKSSAAPPDDADLCAVCIDRTCKVVAQGCGHGLCTRCAFSLCSTSNIKSEASAAPGSIPCPLCREGIVAFKRLPSLPVKNNSMIKSQITAPAAEFCRKQSAVVVPEAAFDP